MNLFIDNKSGAPIYEQLYTQIKNQILSGELQPEEAMPSIRGLARDLRISVITTKRAYDELEQEGFLYAVPAKGFFVAAKNTELLREENLKKIEAHLTEAVRLAAPCGLTKVFTDVLEFQKFTKGRPVRSAVVPGEKIAELLMEDVKGVVLNPLGVNVQLQVARRKRE